MGTLLDGRLFLHQRRVVAGSGEELLDFDVLVLGVGKGGVARAEANCGNTSGVGVTAVGGEGPEAGYGARGEGSRLQ